MPSHKKWVIDEKGYHAKTVFEPAPADQTAVYIDNSPTSNQAEEESNEIELVKGTWIEGKDGFQFNKKCKTRVDAKFLKDTKRTRITINTFVTFTDDKSKAQIKENLGQTIDTNLAKMNKDGMEAIAEAEVMLFYGEKYAKALEGNPGLTCKYAFTAKSPVAKKPMEKSEELEMPRNYVKTISDSVGLNGKNKPEDVKIVKKRLKELGYPVKDESEILSNEDFKAIKFFQTSIVNVENNVKKFKKIWLPDGLISKGGNTEKQLFGNSPSKYKFPIKGEIKAKQKDVKEEIKNATSEKVKKYWKKIEEVWSIVSPFLPADSYMTSGYRTSQDQRDILHNWFNTKYKDEIIDEHSEEEWKKYKNMQGNNDAVADPKMCKMILEATGQLIAVPGTSKHQTGQAIDIGGKADVDQIKSLLWCHVEFYTDNIITKILPERNKCLHFEFK